MKSVKEFENSGTSFLECNEIDHAFAMMNDIFTSNTVASWKQNIKMKVIAEVDTASKVINSVLVYECFGDKLDKVYVHGVGTKQGERRKGNGTKLFQCLQQKKGIVWIFCFGKPATMNDKEGLHKFYEKNSFLRTSMKHGELKNWLQGFDTPIEGNGSIYTWNK